MKLYFYTYLKFTLNLGIIYWFSKIIVCEHTNDYLLPN